MVKSKNQKEYFQRGYIEQYAGDPGTKEDSMSPVRTNIISKSIPCLGKKHKAINLSTIILKDTSLFGWPLQFLF